LRRLFDLCLWKFAKDPRKVQGTIRVVVLLVQFIEFGWFIYGNYLYYTEVVNVNKNLQFMLLLTIIWGYINMLIYFLGCLFGIFLVAGMCLYGIFDSEKREQYEAYLRDKENKT
jgi:hypothetical protein